MAKNGNSKARQVTVHFSLNSDLAILQRYRITIEGVAYGDAATVKDQIAQEVREVLAENPITGAKDVFISTLRQSKNGRAATSHPAYSRAARTKGVETEEVEETPRKPRAKPAKNGTHASAAASVWAAMSPEERTAEMIRRQANRYKNTDEELRARLKERGVATAARKRKWAERPNLWATGSQREAVVNPQ